MDKAAVDEVMECPAAMHTSMIAVSNSVDYNGSLDPTLEKGVYQYGSSAIK